MLFISEKCFFADEKLWSNVIISTGLPYKYMKSKFDIYYDTYLHIKIMIYTT